MILTWVDYAKIAAVLALFFCACGTPAVKRRAFNGCVNRANDAYLYGGATYDQRTERVRACLQEYNK